MDRIDLVDDGDEAVGWGGGVVDAPVTSLFIKCGEFRQAELLSATQRMRVA